MAFFEDLGNGIKNVGSSITNGAKDMTRKNQLNADIAKIQRDINIFYTQLGEATYRNLSAEEENKTDVQPIIDNINGAFMAVKTKEDEIAQIEAEAQARKEEEEARKKAEAEARAQQASAGTCHMCGATILPGSNFCVQCGAPVQKPEPEPEEEITCPNCGAHCDGTAKFCVECGTKLHE